MRIQPAQVWKRLQQRRRSVGWLDGEDKKRKAAVKFTKHMSLPQQDLTLEDAKEQLLEECEEIWKHVEECHNKVTFQEIETLPATDPKLSLLLHRVKSLTAEFNQWQKRTPETISTNPDVLVALGKDQLQRLKHDLEMILSTVHAKNKKLKEDLLRVHLENKMYN